MAPHFAGTVSVLHVYIRVIQHHPQGTLHFYHIQHITIALRCELERWSANVPTETFLVHREGSTSATSEHREPPSISIDCSRTNQLALKGGKRLPIPTIKTILVTTRVFKTKSLLDNSLSKWT